MRWHEIVPEWLALLAADADVQAVLGTNPPAIYMQGERDWKVPSLEWQIVTSPETELWESPLVQLDMWTKSLSTMTTLAAAVRRVLHHDLTIATENYRLWSMLVGGGQLQGPRDGNLGHRLDFRLEYLRRRYAA